MIESLNFDNLNFLIKKRKTEAISFDIDHDNHQFVLVTPQDLDENELNEYISENIHNFKDIAEMFFDTTYLKECVDGENIQIFNIPHVLKLSHIEEIKCDEHNRVLYYPTKSVSSFKVELKEFYEYKLIDFVGVKLEKYTSRIGKSPKKIVINDLAKKWGICTPSGIIKLNWKLAMAPYFVVEYVLCHELTHLKHLNHSKDFNNLLETVYSRKTEAERWLENNFLSLKI